MLRAYLKLTRPGNVILALASGAVGYYLGKGSINMMDFLMPMFAVGFVFSSGNVLNDYFDQTADAVNKPYRPLPSGQLKPAGALIFGLVLMILGLASAIMAGIIHFLLALLAGLLLFIYNWKWKRLPLIGNLTVAFLGGLVFIYGGLGRQLTAGCWFAAAFAFLFHLGREIVKDIEDVEGDRMVSGRTIPLIMGINKAKWIANLALALLIIITLLPYILGLFHLIYFLVVLIIVDSILILIIIKIFKARDRADYNRISRILKLDIVLGLAALLLSKVG
ncbi:geranylgeranylglycerol-phosphate geranylgeranyltransferase [bacterium]|nr:geranylgeranylglycerol-phosphate geranylgeranyltransferase [bacterium]